MTRELQFTQMVLGTKAWANKMGWSKEEYPTWHDHMWVQLPSTLFTIFMLHKHKNRRDHVVQQIFLPHFDIRHEPQRFESKQNSKSKRNWIELKRKRKNTKNTEGMPLGPASGATGPTGLAPCIGKAG